MLVHPAIHQVPSTRGANIFLLEDEEGLAVIDAGLPGDDQAVLEYAASLGYSPTAISRVFVTHGHPDHSGGARALREATGCQVYAHTADCTSAAGGSTLRLVGVPDALRPAAWRCPVDGILAPGAALPVLGGLRVLDMPGHTPGSVCLLSEKTGVLFAGDLVTRRGGHVSRSIPFPGTDLAEYHRSLERLSGLSFDTVCFGHGPALAGNAAEAIRGVASWYLDAPWWRRLLQLVPGPLRPGLETGYRLPEGT